MFFDKLRAEWEWTWRFFFFHSHGYCVTFLLTTLFSAAAIVCAILLTPEKWTVLIIISVVVWTIAFAWFVGYSCVPLYREYSVDHLHSELPCLDENEEIPL